MVHTRRESQRLGDTPPARALRALGVHAQRMTPRFDALFEEMPTGTFAARRFGDLFSALRHYLFDRFVDLERSYRATLLGFHHGVGVSRLLHEVADRLDQREVVELCEEWLVERQPLLEVAEREVSWFADMPRKALHSGLHAVFESSE